MMPTLSEIILILVIVICIFGLGKLGDMSEAIGEMRAKRKGLPGEDAVDITPDEERAARRSSEPKPGRREQPVDEADIEENGPGANA